MNVEKLQEVMLQSTFLIEASLFSQAGIENKRIEKLRGIQEVLEQNICEMLKKDVT